MASSGAGAAFLLALINAWLASHRGGSSLGWFLGSLVFAPIALLFTGYLITRPTVQRSLGEEALTLAAGALWVVVVVLLVGVPSFRGRAPLVGDGLGRIGSRP
jgi:hypothetical protein